MLIAYIEKGWFYIFTIWYSTDVLQNSHWTAVFVGTLVSVWLDSLDCIVRQTSMSAPVAHVPMVAAVWIWSTALGVSVHAATTMLGVWATSTSVRVTLVYTALRARTALVSSSAIAGLDMEVIVGVSTHLYSCWDTYYRLILRLRLTLFRNFKLAAFDNDTTGCGSTERFFF